MDEGMAMDEAGSERGARQGSLWQRIGRVCTGAFVVGVVATICDWATLWGLAELGERFHWDLHTTWGIVPAKNWAVVPGCLVGLLIQFFGNRHFSFGVRGEVGREFLLRHLWRFSLVEGGSLILIAASYNFAIEVVGIDFRIARAVVGLIIYWGFSLPLWHWVFSTKK